MTNRIAAALLLLLCTVPAWAEWIPISKNSDGTAYIDPTTIRKNGNYRQVWVITDFNTIGDQGERSYRLQQEFDCKNERYRTLYGSAHEGQMGAGKIIFSEVSPVDWRPVPPQTSSAYKLELLCK